MRYFSKGLLILLLCMLLSTCALGSMPESLIPGGNTIGIAMELDGISIVELTGTAAKKADLEKGDLIQKINGQAVSTTRELQQAVANSGGAPLRLSLLRGDCPCDCTLAPEQTPQGWKLGLLVRECLHGIGTVTYYNPADQSFGALGHGVNSGEHVLPMERGGVLPSCVASVSRGEKGSPGALQGAVTGEEIGSITHNTDRGIFGTIQSPSKAPLPIGKKQKVHPGPASILSNVQGTSIEEFQVQILSVNPTDELYRNLCLEVTDPELLATTGGIVQGMSGSPIIQDGKLVGAVTHVLVNDPTTGYGIFIENMLDAAA